jgi:hypothetical protein
VVSIPTVPVQVEKQNIPPVPSAAPIAELNNNQTANFNLNRGSQIENLRKQLLEKQQNAQENKEQVFQKFEPELKNSFTNEDFGIVWIQYIAHLEKNAKSRIASFLKNSRYKIQEHQVILELRSNLEQELIEEEKLEMIPFFRSQLKNNLIEFKYTINADLIQQTKKLSRTDILKNMSEKQSLVLDLVQVLGLEIEY